MASYTIQLVDRLWGAIRPIPFIGNSTKSTSTGDTPFTQAILACLHKCAVGFGFTTYKHSCKRGSQHKSFLFDYAWAEYKGEDVLDFPLIAEFELNADPKWRWGEQKEDFEKLLVANAPYRLFICQLDQANHGSEDMESVENKLLDDLSALLQAYRRASQGDVLLIVIMRYRATTKYLRYRELVCGHSGWSAQDGTRA